MKKVFDFNCRYAEFLGIDKELIRENNLEIPKMYNNAKDIANYSKIANISILPLDPVLEAESLGAIIKYDQSNLGPRKDKDRVSSIEELANLPRIDLSKGRLHENLSALKILMQENENATFEIHGPITILSGLGDMMNILVSWRKHEAIMEEFLEKLVVDLADLVEELQKIGCNIIYYTDSVGSVNMLGKKYSKVLVEIFLIPFLKRVEEILDTNTAIHMCPKTSFMLVGYNKANWERLELNRAVEYREACLLAAKKVNFLGQRCRKDDDIEVSHINYLQLLDS